MSVEQHEVIVKQIARFCLSAIAILVFVFSALAQYA
jgi:hypothetical protein